MADESLPSESNSPESALQFRLSTIFILTLITSLLAAFLRPHGEELLLAGLVSVTICSLAAVAIGYFRPPMTDRIFWGIVIAAMMQAVVADVILLDRRTGIYAWPITAGLAGLIAAGHARLYSRMILGGIAAGLCMTIYVSFLEGPTFALAMNVISAAIGGALMAVLIELFKSIERKRIVTQPIIGFILVLGAIGFSWLAVRYIPGW